MFTSESRILSSQPGVLLRGHAGALRFPSGYDATAGRNTRTPTAVVVPDVVARMVAGVRRRGRGRIRPPFAGHGAALVPLPAGVEAQRVGGRGFARKLERR